MSDRVLSVLVVVSAALLLLVISCGGDDDILATAGEREITGDDFRETFDALSPEEQVQVLDPGGRMALMDRIVYRTILEIECGLNPPSGAGFWEELYSTAWLASEFMSSAASAFEAEMTHTDSLLFSTGFNLSVVLVKDSSDAIRTAEDWRENSPSEPSAPMALAPWSSGESSFTQLVGLTVHLPLDLTRLFEDYAGAGPVIRPAYGAWAVGELSFTALDTIYSVEGREGSLLFSRYLSELTPIEINSSSVEALASVLSIEDGLYRIPDPGDVSGENLLASWEEGNLTSSELVAIMEDVRRQNFFEGIPAELVPFAPPEPRLDPGVDMWFFVSRVARTMAQADLASREGITVPEQVVNAARAEHLLRLAVLRPLLTPDSADVYAFFEEHISEYILPERRSVLLAYVDSGDDPPPDNARSFGDLGEYRSMFNAAGEMMPTPLQPIETFGEPLGSAVFSADPGIFSGPVILPERELAAWFEIVEVAGLDTLAPEEIWPVLLDDFRQTRSSEDLERYLVELWALHSVEIDSSRVEGIDPWAETY